MEGGETMVNTLENFLLILSPERKAKVLPLLKALIDKNVASQDTIVLRAEPIPQDQFRYEGKNDCYPTNFYIINDKIGQGGMGVVYKAFDVQLERHVALKVLRKGDEEMMERFVRERKITAELDHPNFVRILTIGQIESPDGKLPFYTMPLIRGDTLEDLVARRVLPGEKGEKFRYEFTQTRLLQVVQQICQTLQSAHDKLIIHRDLKPSNIIVGPYGETYVVDLGLAKRLKESEKNSGRMDAHLEKRLKHIEEKNLTLDTGIGTPFYMAPEQILAPQEVDHRTDIFGIGGILYYILTGQRPQYVLPLELAKYGFTSDTVDAFAFSATMKECKIVSPSRIVTEQREKLKKIHEIAGINPRMPDSVDEALEAICMKALRKNPEERYQSCNELWMALQQHIEGHPELVLEAEAKELTKVMSKKNLDDALEDFEVAERKVQETIRKLGSIGRMAFEEKLKIIDLKIGMSRIYDQRGQSNLIIETIASAKNLIEEPLNAAQRQYIRLLIMEGLAKFNQKEYNGAKELQLKAIGLSQSHPEKKLLVSAYHNYAMACLYDFSKREVPLDFDNGRQAFINCYKLADQLGDVFSAVHARTMLANLLLEKNEYKEELNSTLEGALKIAAGDDSLTSEVHTLLSWHYLKQKDYNETIKHGELAVELADKSDNQINLNEARLALGQAYHQVGNSEKRIQNLKPVLTFSYAREPLSYEDAVKEFYTKNALNLQELA